MDEMKVLNVEGVPDEAAVVVTIKSAGGKLISWQFDCRPERVSNQAEGPLGS